MATITISSFIVCRCCSLPLPGVVMRVITWYMVITYVLNCSISSARVIISSANGCIRHGAPLRPRAPAPPPRLLRWSCANYCPEQTLPNLRLKRVMNYTRKAPPVRTTSSTHDPRVTSHQHGPTERCAASLLAASVADARAAPSSALQLHK